MSIYVVLAETDYSPSDPACALHSEGAARQLVEECIAYDKTFVRVPAAEYNRERVETWRAQHPIIKLLTKLPPKTSILTPMDSWSYIEVELL